MWRLSLTSFTFPLGLELKIVALSAFAEKLLESRVATHANVTSEIFGFSLAAEDKVISFYLLILKSSIRGLFEMERKGSSLNTGGPL